MKNVTNQVVDKLSKKGMKATLKRASEDSPSETLDIMKNSTKRDPAMKYIIVQNGKYRITKKLKGATSQEYFGVYDELEVAQKMRDELVLMVENGYSSHEIKEKFGIGNRSSSVAITSITPMGDVSLENFTKLYADTKDSNMYTKDQRDIISSLVKKKIEIETLIKEINSELPSIIGAMEIVAKDEEMERMRKYIKELEKEKLEGAKTAA